MGQMIKTIEISNFQSHKDTILNLSRGVNVIKGRTHSGKSSIIRALDWALLNRIRGDYFVSHFRDKKGETSVGIEFYDREYIIRKKTPTVNGYELSIGGDIEAIRTDLPEEVRAITNMTEINLQAQDELYYMLKETPGYVAKELNSLVGLDIIDQTLTNLNKLENENTVKLKLLEKDSKKVKENLEELDYLDDLEKKVIQIESLWKEYGTLRDKQERLEGARNEILELTRTIDNDEEWLKIKEPVDELLQMLKDHSIQQSLHDKLKDCYVSINSIEIVRLRSDGLLKTAMARRDKIINSAEYKKQFCRYCGAHSDHWRKT